MVTKKNKDIIFSVDKMLIQHLVSKFIIRRAQPGDLSSNDLLHSYMTQLNAQSSTSTFSQSSKVAQL